MAIAKINLGVKLAGSMLGLMVLAGCGGGSGEASYESQAPAEGSAGEVSPAPVASAPPAPVASAPAAPAAPVPAGGVPPQPNSGPQSAPAASPPPALGPELMAAQQAVSQVYDQLLVDLPQGTREKMMASQVNWETMRDGNCQIEVDLYGEQRGGRWQCLVLLTRNRQTQLTAIASQTLLSGLSEGTGLGQVALGGEIVDCDDPSAPTTIQNYCAGLVYARDDKTLNEIYQDLKGSLSASSKKTLTQAQLAWIKMRDFQCEVETAPAVGGTGFEGYRNHCLAEATRLRTAELRTLLYDMP
ncbi:MAG: lysozyme inhibitor LprI family protein [Cyanobacteria bacterium P01_F01_bin.153]